MRLPMMIAGLLLSQAAAAADASRSYVELYSTRPDISVDGRSGSVDGSGWGFRGWVGRSWPFVTFDYEDVETDGRIGGVATALLIERLRAGAGAYFVNTPVINAWGRLEMINNQGDDGIGGDGAGLHFGLRVGAPIASGHLEVGVLQLDNADGTEVRIGGTFDPANYGLFLEYRLTVLDPDAAGAGDVTEDNLRFGLRWTFY